MNIKKLVCSALAVCSIFSASNCVFAQNVNDKDGDGKIGLINLYKTENVQSNGTGDYLLEIKLEEGWVPYADIKITLSNGSLCTSMDKGYKPSGERRVLEDVVGATLEDYKNLGTIFKGKITTPKDGGIIEVPLNVCSEHRTDGFVNEAGITVTVNKDNAKFYAQGSVKFANAKPIIEGGTSTSTTPTVTNGKASVKFTIGTSKYVVTDRYGNQTTKTMLNSDKPYMTSGRTMVPVRYAGEALNAQVTWNPAVKEVIVRKDSTTVRLPLNSQYAIYSDGSKVDMGAKTVQKNGRTYVPVGALGRMLNANVSWDSKTKTATITQR